jgi:hypothetical protein
MSQRLTNKQLIRRKIRETLSSAEDSPPSVNVGTRHDFSHRHIQRPCLLCGQPTFTSQRFPDDVALVCNVCFDEMLHEEGFIP